ncbi:MAG: hypothetical protein LAO77_21230 [Acidobacteriia bacterium]|nr:hypothetical protein [Terriglobia bacterium]
MPSATTVARQVILVGILASQLLAVDSAAAGAPMEIQSAAAALCHGAGSPAIRSNFTWVDQLVLNGIAHSATFASEAQELSTSDLVVFLEPVMNMPSELSAYLVFMSATPACRFVRIRYDIHLSDPRAIAMIGHELRHALEIANHPEVVDNLTLSAMYKRFGKRVTDGEMYDSVEAVTAGRIILQELLNPVALNADDDR